jgi:hypothetical protein
LQLRPDSEVGNWQKRDLSMKAIVLAALAVVGVVHASDCAKSQELLRVGGQVVKWASPKSATPTVVTYALLQSPFAVPRDKSTLSPDNCSEMLPFAKVLSTSPSISETTAKRQLRAAFRAWSSVADISFMEVEDTHKANIVIGTSSVAKGRAFANLSYRGRDSEAGPVTQALGGDNRSKLIEREGAVIDQAYICLNPMAQWKIGFDGNLDVYDLRYTLMHEIGHAIGLDHPGTTGAVMAYRYDERVAGLQASDVEAVQTLYGPPRPKK